ncbi:MAG TPA: hypothetical protein VFQ39_12225, partial [Longimicrobium sp.]|nr:hypothetical protein [Longimicrobium sp.]
LAGRDYSDLYYATGGRLAFDRGVGKGWTGELSIGAEAQRSASLEADVSLAGSDFFRPVHAIDEGMLLGGALLLTRASPSGRAVGWTTALRADGGRLLGDDGAGDFTFVRPRLDVGYARRWEPRSASLEVELSAGTAFGDLPRQGLYLIGGRGTVPGFPFRAYGGDKYAVAGARASADLFAPFLRGRLSAAAGWTDVGDPGRASLSAWGARTARDPIVGVSAGVGIFYDILRFDVARGIGPDGQWELIIEANPAFWDFL